MEESEEWLAYVALSPEERATASSANLLGRALVQAFVALDEELLSLKECGIMDESGCTLVTHRTLRHP